MSTANSQPRGFALITRRVIIFAALAFCLTSFAMIILGAISVAWTVYTKFDVISRDISKKFGPLATSIGDGYTWLDGRLSDFTNQPLTVGSALLIGIILLSFTSRSR
ncbi:hypothetical protein GOA57_05165 [Sinorhizobium meliloti]|nr:hypothetical protein [Sinorhizobium meliloti]